MYELMSLVPDAYMRHNATLISLLLAKRIYVGATESTMFIPGKTYVLLLISPD